jgi:hypothetical protein
MCARFTGRWIPEGYTAVAWRVFVILFSQGVNHVELAAWFVAQD